MRGLIGFVLILLLLLSAGSMLTGFVTRHRADAILTGLQRIDSALSVVENKINSIHTGVEMQHQFAITAIEGDAALKEAMDRVRSVLTGESDAEQLLDGER